jgi:uncharacterized protein (DUF1919 family)
VTLIKQHNSKVTGLFDDLRASFKRRFSDRVFAGFLRAKLNNTNFSIISNDCVAAGIYQKFGLRYNTPTVGLFFFSEDYINFLENFENYILQPLKFARVSRHLQANELRKVKYYPIGILSDGVEVHFLHYETEGEAAEKWNRRVKRVNFKNLFFLYSDTNNFHDEFLARYQKLPFERKIFFSSKPRREYGCVVFIRDYQNQPQVGDSSRNRRYEKYINIIRWLNCEADYLKVC